MKLLTKHYIILCEWSSNDFEGMDIIAVAHTLEEAKEIFAEKVIEEKEYAEQNDWEIFTDTDISFDAGIEEFYGSEHVCLTIREV